MPVLIGALNAMLSTGGSYFLATLGWVLLYKGTRTLNFATGQFYLLAPAIFVWVGVSSGRYVAAVIAVVGCGAAGAVVYFLFIKRLVGRSEFTIVIVTFGISILMQEIIQGFLGSTNYIGVPLVTDSVLIRIDNQPLLTGTGLLAFGAAITVFAATMLTLRKTRVGIQSRALGEHPALASQSGVNTLRTGAIIWFIGTLAVGLGGLLYASNNIITPSLSDIGLLGIIPALIGGLESVPGALVGSMFVAPIEYLAGYYLGGQNQEAALFVMVLLFLLFRPAGLFGAPQRERA